MFHDASNNVAHQSRSQQRQEEVSAPLFTTRTPSPSISPETQQEFTQTNIEFEGWLNKRASWLKDWRRRYFKLAGSQLFFATDRWSAPHGMIDLRLATDIVSTDTKNHAFQIRTREAAYLMRAGSQQEKDDWIESLEKQIIRRNEGENNLIQNDIADEGTLAQRHQAQDEKEKVYEGKDDASIENTQMHPILMLEALYSGSTS